jgi:small subunit ribosomal protein S12
MSLTLRLKNLFSLRHIRQHKRSHKRRSLLENCPQKLAVCRKVFIASPKKPNSANRKVAKIQLISTKNMLFAYIPGQCPHGLSAYSQALIRGGRVRDLPGIRYKLIRGTHDFKGVPDRKSSRSKYGVKRSKNV